MGRRSTDRCRVVGGFRSLRRRSGLTLIELMLVVIILAVLATSVIIPAISKHGQDAKASAFVANLRHFAQQYAVHEQREGAFPDDEPPGILPAEMTGEVDETAWAAPTPVGGNWDWDYGQFGVTAGLSVFRPDATDAQMEAVDALVDDGDLNTGAFQRRVDGFILVLSD